MIRRSFKWTGISNLSFETVSKLNNIVVTGEKSRCLTHNPETGIIEVSIDGELTEDVETEFVDGCDANGVTRPNFYLVGDEVHEVPSAGIFSRIIDLIGGLWAK